MAQQTQRRSLWTDRPDDWMAAPTAHEPVAPLIAPPPVPESRVEFDDDRPEFFRTAVIAACFVIGLALLLLAAFAFGRTLA